jgi:hypothetical protein
MFSGILGVAIVGVHNNSFESKFLIVRLSTVKCNMGTMVATIMNARGSSGFLRKLKSGFMFVRAWASA